MSHEPPTGGREEPEEPAGVADESAPSERLGGGLIGLAIERPVSVSVGVILVVLFGALSIFGLPIQLTPDISTPTLSVSTTWPGASPTEIEADILEQQEEALKSLPGLERMTSTMRRNRGSITLELAVGSDIDQALVRASNLLSSVARYPEAAQEPRIETADSAGPPLAVLVVQATNRGDVAEYRTWMAEEIVPRLDRIKGIAGVRLIGGRELEVHIDFDPSALASRRITLDQLARVLRTRFADISAGDVAVGKRRYTVRTALKPLDVAALESLVITAGPDGNPVTIGQVATVSTGMRKPESIGMVNGFPSMAMLLTREAGYNVLEVTKELHIVTADLQERLLAPEGLEMRIVSDQVEYIEGALELVQNNLLLGGALAVLVLLIFLRSLGASLVVAVSIPVSIVGTVLGMSLLDRTVNIVSLAGMAFAVGMVVDNAIVVLENIDTWLRRGVSIKVAALRGTREVWGAIVASTATTAAVFIPVIAWQDEVGELLRDVAVAISVAVGASLIVSVLVIPSFAAKLLRRRKPKVLTDEQRAAQASKRGFFGAQVHWLIRSPLRALVVALVGVGVAGWLGATNVPSLEYLPSGNRNFVFGVVIPPPGYSVDALQELGDTVLDRLMPHVGQEVDGKPELARAFFVGSPDSAFMGAVGVDPKRVDELADLVRASQRGLPDTFAFASKASLFGRRAGSSRSIDVDLSGADLTGMLALGGRLMGALRGALPGAQVRPIPGLDAGAPEVRVTPIPDRARALGFDDASLGLAVDAYVDGAIIGELGSSGEPKRNVLLRAKNLNLADPESLRRAPIATPSGEVVAMGEVVKLEDTIGPSVIQHVERRRALTLAVSPPRDMPLEEAIRTVREDVVEPLIAQGAVPPGIDIAYAGSAGRLESAKSRLTWVLLLAVIVCFLLLSALFEDFIAPIAILVTVPLAGAGGVLGLYLVNTYLGKQPLDMMTAVGFVILIGVVVNNAILVVDGALNRLRSGMALADATSAAVQARVRPIFMSALTSLAGLLPLVLFPGSGSELYRGVGAIVLGGLALSTVLTLYIVPAVFTTLWRVLGRGRTPVPSTVEAAA